MAEVSTPLNSAVKTPNHFMNDVSAMSNGLTPSVVAARTSADRDTAASTTVRLRIDVPDVGYRVRGLVQSL